MLGELRNVAVAEQQRHDGDARRVLRAVIQGRVRCGDLVAVQDVVKASRHRPCIGARVEHRRHGGALVGFVERAGAGLRAGDVIDARLQNQDVMVVAVGAVRGAFDDCVGPRRKWPVIGPRGIDLAAVRQIDVSRRLIRRHPHPRNPARSGIESVAEIGMKRIAQVAHRNLVRGIGIHR